MNEFEKKILKSQNKKKFQFNFRNINQSTETKTKNNFFLKIQLFHCFYITYHLCCVFLCVVKLDDCENDLLHFSHLNALMPLCFTICWVRLDDVVALNSH